MMRSGLFVTVTLVACTVHAQTANSVASAIARDTEYLVVAALAGDLIAVNRLLESGTDVNQRLMGRTAYDVAVQARNVEMVQVLLTAGADVNECCGASGALFHAARARDLQMVKVLLAANADLNRQGEVSGDTALMHGIFQQSKRNPAPMEIARLLVEAGADVSLANKTGVTALLLAVQGNDPDNLAMVEALVARGANVDHRRCYSVPDSPMKNSWRIRAVGATALGLASSVSNPAAVRALIAANANVDFPQCDGKTPLELALENGNEEGADILRSAMASTDATQ